MYRITALFIIFIAFSACSRQSPGDHVPTPFDNADEVITPNPDMTGVLGENWDGVTMEEVVCVEHQVVTEDTVIAGYTNAEMGSNSHAMVTFDNIPEEITHATIRFKMKNVVDEEDVDTNHWRYEGGALNITIARARYEDLGGFYQGPCIWEEGYPYEGIPYVEITRHNINDRPTPLEDGYVYIDVSSLLNTLSRTDRLQIAIHSEIYYPVMISDIELALFAYN